MENTLGLGAYLINICVMTMDVNHVKYENEIDKCHQKLNMRFI